jgi:RHS repeat-associated protein
MNYPRILLFLLSLICGFAPLSAEAQVSDNNYCHNLTTTANKCFGSQEAAEAAMKALLPASYRDVIQPKTPVPAGQQPNAQGLELWKIDYFIPDQPPPTTYPPTHTVSGWNASSNGICSASNDPLDPNGCLDGEAAAVARYEYIRSTYPQCTLNKLAFQGAYAVPFSSVSAASYNSRYGTIQYTPKDYYATRQLPYTTLCPGWTSSTTSYNHITKRQTIHCADKFSPVAGYSSLSESPNGVGTVIGEALCRPIDTMPTITFYQRGAATCPAGKKPAPCHPATGDKSRDEVDFQFAGESFTRYYHSLRQTGTLPAFAPGWTHTFSDRILDGGTYNMKTVRGDGNVEYFVLIGSNQFKSSQTSRKKLVKIAGGTYKIYDESGKVLTFNSTGRLIRQEHSTNGLYAIDFTYDGEKLIRAQDQTGRALILNYVNNRLDSIKLPDGSTVQYAFDTLGNFTSATYQDGTSKQYHYNEAGLSPANNRHALTGITTENGLRYSSYGYAANGRVNISQRHKGDGTFVEKTAIDYSNIDQPVVTLPHGEVVTYGITNEGPYRRITSMAGGSGSFYVVYTGGALSQTTYGSTVSKYSYTGDYLSTRYEAFGTPQERKFVTVRDSEYRTTSYEVQAKLGANHVAKLRQTFTYNSRGQVLTANTIDPATSAVRTLTLTYCEQADVDASICPLVGLLKTVDGARIDIADITTYTYYPSDASGCVPGVSPCSHRKGDLWKITNALSQVTEILGYDDAGRPTAVTDANGVDIDLEYDTRGRLIARKLRGTNAGTESDDQITGIEYWPTGLIKKMNVPGGSSLSFTYDDAHRLTGIADNAGNSITYTLNAASKRLKEDTRDNTGALQRTLSRTYNTLDQLSSITDAYQRTSSFEYVDENLDQATDAKLRVEDSNYDPLNRFTRTLRDMNGIASETKFDYDALDNLKQVNDPKGLNTNYDYNGFSDLTQLSSPDTGVTGYTYDSAGNRASQTDARNVTASYTYDALNRPTSITYPTSSLNIGYIYDTAQAPCTAGETFTVGRLTRIVDGSGNTVYCYDRFGNLVRKVQTTNGKVFTLRYIFNVAGQLAGMVYPDGAVVDYVHDAQGRVTEVGAQPAGGTRQVVLSNAAYYPFGPVAQWTYGNNRVMKRSLNQNYQPGFVEVIGAGGLNIGYEFDEVGNLKKLRTANQVDPPLRVFDYDGLNRLTENKDGATNVLLERYGYDKTGNRTSATIGEVTTAYGYLTGNHRLNTVGAATARVYDATGNTTSIPGTLTKNFVYGDHNRMTQYKEGTTVKMNYVYNGGGEQVRKYATSTANVYSLYNEAGQWLGAYDDSGMPAQQIVWLDNLPIGVLAGASTSQKLYYVEADALGSPRVVVDPARGVSGTAVWTWDLTGEAFGKTAPNQDPDVDSTQFVFDMRFPGQRYDAVSGVNYNYFRDYEAGTGRYVESDPIGLGGGVSTYSYALSNPLILVDPKGQTPAAAAVCLIPGVGWGGCAVIGATAGIVACYTTGTCERAANAAGNWINDRLSGWGEESSGGNVIPFPSTKKPDANCPNEPDDEDPCEEWADELIAMRLSIMALQVKNPHASHAILIAQYHSLRSTFCQNCRHLCNQVPPF